MSGARRLCELAKTIRSKNAGVDKITFDVIFPDRDSYDLVRRSRVLTRASIADLLGIPPERISDFAEFAPANAIKFTIYRATPSGSPGDSDVFGCQQYAPLMDVAVPDAAAEGRRIEGGAAASSPSEEGRFPTREGRDEQP